MIRRTVLLAARAGKPPSVRRESALAEDQLPRVAYAEGHRLDSVEITTGPVDPHGDAPTWRQLEDDP
jgi:hypothetical protein